jgi:hypothetical protein
MKPLLCELDRVDAFGGTMDIRSDAERDVTIPYEVQ